MFPILDITRISNKSQSSGSTDSITTRCFSKGLVRLGTAALYDLSECFHSNIAEKVRRHRTSASVTIANTWYSTAMGTGSLVGPIATANLDSDQFPHPWQRATYVPLWQAGTTECLSYRPFGVDCCIERQRSKQSGAVE